MFSLVFNTLAESIREHLRTTSPVNVFKDKDGQTEGRKEARKEERKPLPHIKRLNDIMMQLSQVMR